MSRHLLGSMLALLLALGFSASPAAADDLPEIADVIARIVANEALYAQLELVIHKQYDLVKLGPQVRGSLVRSEETTTRCIYQNRKIFTAIDRRGVTVAGKPISHIERAAFDGTSTRINRDGVATGHEGAQFHPHGCPMLYSILSLRM